MATCVDDQPRTQQTDGIDYTHLLHARLGIMRDRLESEVCGLGHRDGGALAAATSVRLEEVTVRCVDNRDIAGTVDRDCVILASALLAGVTGEEDAAAVNADTARLDRNAPTKRIS